jgi:hypothetical protein
MLAPWARRALRERLYTTPKEEPGMTELARRSSDNIDVSLLWDRDRDNLFVVVEDISTGDRCSLVAQRERALDIYYHPFAYGAQVGS